MKLSKNSIIIPAIATTLFITTVLPASAITLTFDDGDAANSNLSSADNWDPAQVPTAADDLIIPVGFTATGNLGGGTGTQAQSVLIQGSVDNGLWALVPLTIDGGWIGLGGGGGAFSSGTADLINDGTMTFKAKTATEVVAQYAANITIDGNLSSFGSDPLVIEEGDNALITENGAPGADNVTVSMVTDPGNIGAFTWTDAGVGSGTDNPTNWLSEASGTYPTETPSEGLAEVYTFGVDIIDAASCIGNLDVGPNTMVISNVTAVMTGGSLAGDSTINISEAALEKAIVSDATVLLNDNAVLQLTDGGTPVAGSATVDLNSFTASLKFDNETAADFISEHASKVSVFGATLEFGTDPFVHEPGDNVLATEFNSPLGVEITAVVVDPNVLGTLEWTGAATTNLTGNVTNWVNTATGTYPSETPWGGLELSYTGGVVIAFGTPDGPLVMGGNELVINGGAFATNSVGTGYNGGTNLPPFLLENATFAMQWCAEGTVTLADNSLMTLNGGGAALGGVGSIHSTVDFVGSSARLQFNNEDLAAFIAEHEAFVTVNGAAAVFGSDYYVEEPGDNAIALAHNGVTGIEIRPLGIDVQDPIGTIVIAGPIAGNQMTITWDTSLDQVYNVETNSNLIIANWGVADTTIGTGGSITVTTAVDQVQTFYRVTTP